MCGPEGTGLFYARAENLDQLEQTFVGPFGMRQHSLDYLGATFDVAEGAGRFDVGSANLALLAGQKTSMEWIKDEIGMDWITRRIADLGAYAYRRLAEIPGIQMVTPPERMAGLITFVVEGFDPEELTRRLSEEHNVTIRFVDTYINNPRANRLSAGFYNTPGDIERLAHAITSIRSAATA
jgi:selenocysteine lyase/cysteine desulfurase